jgi:thiol-disulfide isomerase/thioredoxin
LLFSHHHYSIDKVKLNTIFLTLALSFMTVAPNAMTTDIDSTDILIVNFEEYQEYLKEFGNRTLIINFWATWCIPCVEEMPYFERVTSKYDSDEVQVILVSLDFTNQIKTNLIPFIEKNKLKSKVILLDDPDVNTWIDKINPEWSGAIPATMIKKGNKEAFYEKSFHSFDELEEIIQPFLNS